MEANLLLPICNPLITRMWQHKMLLSEIQNAESRQFPGQFEFGYKSLAFLTFRGRNDWSSTLPPDNNTYFYPAVEGSVIS